MKKFARFALIAVIVAGMTGCRYADDASDTAFSEFKASSLLDKYKRFKDMYAALDSKRATINLLKGKIKSTEEQYKGVPRKEWAREDLQTINQWKGELDGVKASYNDLAADYNSAMSKANVNFTNVGDLPKGATEPLPREVAPYIND
jgi:hypothetical protein